MTLLASCNAVSKSFGADLLFNQLSIGFFSGERLGLVGPNGAGKSTLLKILMGLEDEDSGEVALRKDLRISYLAQSDHLLLDKSIEENLLESMPVGEDDEMERYQKVQRMVGKVGFSDATKKAELLSGGWRKRLAIACALLQEPELLLMDEPTNHLDLESILWLEKVLQRANFAIVLVSHDRYFLENCTTHILELNRQFPEGFYKAKGVYSEFLEAKDLFLQQQEKQESVLHNKLRREIEWLRRGPKARTTKAKYRIDDAEKLRQEHADVKKRNAENQKIEIQFGSSERKTRRLLVATKIAKTLGDQTLFENLDLILSPGTRLGILGKNGSGKSTLLHLLCRKLQPDKGTIKWADNLNIVFFDQKREELELDIPLRKALAPEGDSVVYQGKSRHVISWGKRFLFRADQMETPVANLSGGERARILIARLMLQPADILILDEPTNDLDIASLQVLEESLMEFPGAIVLVTHDRYLLDQVATQVLGLGGSKENFIYPDCSQWLAAQRDASKEKKKPTKEKEKNQKKKVTKLSYKDQRELEQIEKGLPEAEENVSNLEALLSKPEISNQPKEMQKACDSLHSAQEKVEKLYTRWEELETLKGELSS